MSGSLSRCRPATRSRSMSSRTWAAVTSVGSSLGPSRCASRIVVQLVRPVSSAATNEYGQPGIICAEPFATAVAVAEQPLAAGWRVGAQPGAHVHGQRDAALVVAGDRQIGQ